MMIQFFCNTVNNFWTSDNEILSVKSPYDTGKTQFIKSVLDKYNPTKVLFVSYRITLAYDIEGAFYDYNFKNYKDGEFNANRLINQTESLMKLLKGRETVPKYDLIVIDEIESVLRQFNSPTFRGKAPAYFEVLTFLILSASKVICLDGDINERTYTFINSISESHGYTHIVNNINFNTKTLNFIDDDVVFNNRIIKDLQDDLKLVIPTMSARYGIDLKATLTSKFPDKTILLYIADTDDKEKHNITNILENWSKADVVIYSPTIEAGVSFDKQHFDRLYGYLSDNSCSQLAFFQMMSRVRKFNNNDFYIYINEIILNKNSKSWNINELKEKSIYNDDTILK